MTIATLIAGLLIFSIGFALGFFVCVLGIVMTKTREDQEKKEARNNTHRDKEEKRQ